MAQAIVHDRSERTSLPPSFAPVAVRRDRAAVGPVEPDRRGARTIAQLSASGAQGHVVQIVDPAEESSRIRAASNSSSRKAPARITAGRAETWRERLRRARRAPPRRNPRRDRPARLELRHPPHRPAGERTAAVRCMRAWAPASATAASTRWHARARAQRSGMIAGLPLAFAEPLVLLGLLSLPVLWWLLRLIPPRPRRIDFPPTRLLLDIAPQGRDAVAHAVVAHAAAAGAGGAGHHRRRRTDVESAGRDAERRRAARDPDRRRLGRGLELGRAPAHRRRIDRAGAKTTTAASHSCRCRRRPATFRSHTPAPRACACSRSSRSRIRSTAPRRCRRSSASSPHAPTSKWSGCRTASISASGTEFVEGLAQAIGNRPLTIVDGGIAAAACARRRRQRRRRADA